MSTDKQTTAPASRTTVKQVAETYAKTARNLRIVRSRLGRPLTYAEKALFGHLTAPDDQPLERGRSYLLLRPDRVAMQDVSAQMAILQFMLAGKDAAEVPATVHCDHLIQAHRGSASDLAAATSANAEVYDFLASASSRFNLGFWEPGSGIIHQVVLENYAFPGGLIIGTDSHTANAGGLGMFASGVGGSDAADVMAGLPWEVKNPKIIGVRLKGKLGGWASAKDVILKLCGMLTTKGGTDKVIEYFGEGAASISCTGKATIANMGAELGATTSIFPFDEKMAAYLRATFRADLAELAEANRDLLGADPEVIENPRRYFDEFHEIDLSALEPHVVGPHSPDVARPLSQLAKEAKANGWSVRLSSALIGSCTNSSYEDIGRAASIARQAAAMGAKMPQQFLVSPGSSLIRNTIDRDGLMKVFTEVGATVLANACGPCIGQWKRDDIKSGDANTILSSFNRNFRGRNDANRETLHFIASPEIVMALGLAGRLDFNPLTDSLNTPNGKLRFQEPDAPQLPEAGFTRATEGCRAPQGEVVTIAVDPKSERLRLLSPFARWNGKDLIGQFVLAKVKGKCTTDHISPAGAWLRYRGHLPNISNNLLLGAMNAFTGETGKGRNHLTGQDGVEFAQIARAYRNARQGWVIVGDENYGEGSSRELAAMSPRYLGCTAVIAKSFARIHESNLKKQGLLALTFVDPEDYNKIGEEDRVSLGDLRAFAPGAPVKMLLTRKDGSTEEMVLKHSYNDEHIKWFQAGSALNHVRDQR